MGFLPSYKSLPKGLEVERIFVLRWEKQEDIHVSPQVLFNVALELDLIFPSFHGSFSWKLNGSYKEWTELT